MVGAMEVCESMGIDVRINAQCVKVGSLVMIDSLSESIESRNFRLIMFIEDVIRTYIEPRVAVGAK